ncbi:hypothetical protein [Petrachloros mirabilis]
MRHRILSGSVTFVAMMALVAIAADAAKPSLKYLHTGHHQISSTMPSWRQDIVALTELWEQAIPSNKEAVS